MDVPARKDFVESIYECVREEHILSTNEGLAIEKDMEENIAEGVSVMSDTCQGWQKMLWTQVWL